MLEVGLQAEAGVVFSTAQEKDVRGRACERAPFRKDVTQKSWGWSVHDQLRNKPVGTPALPVGRAADALLCIVEPGVQI